MRHLLTIILSFLLLGCLKSLTTPESFKSDEKCYVVVESSFSSKEKFKEMLKEALEDKKSGIEDLNLEYEENDDGIQDGQGTFTYAKGTFTYFNGDKYEGEWKDWKHHGQGT